MLFSRRSLARLSARILNPPEIHYRARQGQGEAIEHVAVGKWRINNRFYNTPEISSWGMIYIGSQPNPEINGILNAFAQQLPEVRERLFLR